MSSVAPSSDRAPTAARNENPTKRHRVSNSPSRAAGTTSPNTATPVEASREAWEGYLSTLNVNLQPYLRELLVHLHRAHSSHHWKQLKHDEMEIDDDYVPSSCKIGLTLNALEEVKKSEEYQTLSVQLDAVIDDCQRQLAGFAVKAHGLTVRALHDRWKVAFCTILPAVVKGFLAEHDIENYNAHQAVVDTVAKYPDEMIAMLNTSVTTFFRKYKEANGLVSIPPPSFDCAIAEDIAAANDTTAPRADDASATPANTRVSGTAAANNARTPAPAPNNGTAAGSGTNVTVGNMLTHVNGTPVLHLQSHRGRTSTVPETEVMGNQTSALRNPYTVTPANAWGRGAPPSVAPRNPWLRQSQATAARAIGADNTHAELAALNQGETLDTTMDDATVNFDDIIIGGKAVIMEKLANFTRQAIHEPILVFLDRVKAHQDSKRIKIAMKTPAANATAARIAAVVNAGRPAAPPTLCGLITDKVDDATTELQKEVQSLKAKMATMAPSKRGGDGGSNRRQVKQAKAARVRKTPTKTRTAAAGNNGTAGGNKSKNTSSKKRPGKNKSNGKRRGSKTNTNN